MSVLSLACECISNNDDVRIYQWILEKGPNINMQDKAGRTALHVAARAGNVLAIHVLLLQPLLNKDA